LNIIIIFINKKAKLNNKNDASSREEINLVKSHLFLWANCAF